MAGIPSSTLSKFSKERGVKYTDPDGNVVDWPYRKLLKNIKEKQHLEMNYPKGPILMPQEVASRYASICNFIKQCQMPAWIRFETDRYVKK